MSVILRLLGGLRLEADGVTPSARALQKKRLALLAVIGASPTARVSRDRLTGLLWPEADAERARHQLASALYDLRKAFGETALVSTGDEVSLDRTVIQVDAADFQDAIAEGDRERAGSLYAGPFLDGFFLSDAPELERWVDAERARLAQMHARAIEELAREATGRGDFLRAVEWWRTLAAQDPFNSRVAVGLISALDAADDRGGALRHARIHSELLVAELGVEPNAEVAALVERLRASPDRVTSPTRALADLDVSVADAGRSGGPHATPAPPSSMEAPVDRSPARYRTRTIALSLAAALLVLLIAIAGRWAWSRGDAGDAAATAPAVRAQPIVLMMDSPHPSRVYDEEIARGSGTNADVINDLVRDLPIQRVKETAGPLWHRHEEMRALDPDLVLIHLSAFCNEQCEPDRVKMRQFIEYLADGRAQFLIYSRMPPDTLAVAFEKMMGDLPQRFPSLSSRVHTFAVITYGPPHWKDPATSAQFKLQVKRLLGLK